MHARSVLGGGDTVAHLTLAPSCLLAGRFRSAPTVGQKAHVENDPGCVKTQPLLRSVRLNRRGLGMTRFVQGTDRGQSTLLPECLDDWVVEDNAVRVIDAFVDALDLADLGFDIEPAATGRPSYLPSTLLKLYICG